MASRSYLEGSMWAISRVLLRSSPCVIEGSNYTRLCLNAVYEVVTRAKWIVSLVSYSLGKLMLA